jgi:predicted nucleic-acid-binding protein
VNITADANVLVRALMGDHPTQSAAARAMLDKADRIAIPSPALCEFVWVLARVYKKKPADIAVALRHLFSNPKVDVDMEAVGAGLTFLEAGGGFADGVIAWDGRRLGGETFVTFDRQAAKLVQKTGGAVRLLPAG